MKNLLLVLLLIVCLQLNSQTLLNGLEACYPLDMNANNYASTGSTLNGTLTMVTPTTGHLGIPNTAVQLNGTTQSYVELPNDPKLKGDSMTISAWFYIDALPNEQYLVYTKNNCSSNFEAYSLITWDDPWQGTQVFRVSKSDNTCTYAPQVNSTTIPTIGNWYHIVFYIDESVIKLWVNGVLEGSSVHNNLYDYDVSKTVFLGVTNEPSFNLPFSGRIDDVRFYNRELTITEISQLYNGNHACAAVPASTIAFAPGGFCAGGSRSFSATASNSPTSWSWQVSSPAIPATSTSSNPTFQFPSPGIYTITLTSSNGNGPGASNTQTLSVDECINISQIENQSDQLKVYPNPSSGSFKMQNSKAHSMSFEIISVVGTVLRNGTVNENSEIELELGDLPPGIYFMHVKDVRRFQSIKLIKN